MMQVGITTKVLGVIPARGGSKSIPRKNIIPLFGKPLLAYTIEAALASKLLTRFVVSTDDAEISSVAHKYGADVPFLRPAEIASDDALSLPVIQHATRKVEKLDDTVFDVVVMLQPSTPLRTSEDIDTGISMLIESNSDSVISVVEVDSNHPFRMKRVLDDGRLINYIDQGFEDMRPRQQLPPVFIRSGALYITQRDVLMEQNSFVGQDCRAYIMPKERAVNIDSEFDLQLAEFLLNARYLGSN